MSFMSYEWMIENEELMMVVIVPALMLPVGWVVSKLLKTFDGTSPFLNNFIFFDRFFSNSNMNDKSFRVMKRVIHILKPQTNKLSIFGILSYIH